MSHFQLEALLAHAQCFTPSFPLSQGPAVL